MTPVSTVEAMPVPPIERRDDIGRLVAVTWHGSAVHAVNGNNRWLVAVATRPRSDGDCMS